MTEHHKHASEKVARAIFDGLGSIEKAAVLKEAREKGVDPLEIVRGSLDILIEDAGRAPVPGGSVKPAAK